MHNAATNDNQMEGGNSSSLPAYILELITSEIARILANDPGLRSPQGRQRRASRAERTLATA